LNLDLILKINELKNFEYIYEFYYDNMLDFLEMNHDIEGFKLAMRTKSTKFSKSFRMGRSSFLEFDEFMEVMYTLPYDIFLYHKYMNKVLYFDFIFDLYNEKFINYFFLKDFYNFRDKIDHKKSYKLVNLYNKLNYLSFYIIDPFCFKYFWRQFFPERLEKLERLFSYLQLYMIQCGIRGFTTLNIINYDFFHHYFS